MSDIGYTASEMRSRRALVGHFAEQKTKKEFFFKKQSERVIENKGLGKKQTENKPETKLPKLLKTKEGPKKQSGNKPKNKAGHLVENKRS